MLDVAKTLTGGLIMAVFFYVMAVAWLCFVGGS